MMILRIHTGFDVGIRPTTNPRRAAGKIARGSSENRMMDETPPAIPFVPRYFWGHAPIRVFKEMS
jgi:hypothetical protein